LGGGGSCPGPGLLTAASIRATLDHSTEGLAYAEAAVALEDDPRFEPFTNGWGRYWEAVGNVYAGRLERGLEIFTAMAEGGPSRVAGRCGQAQMLPLLGRDDEALAIADDALAAARAHGNPYLVAWALYSHAYAHCRVDPDSARATFAEGLAYAETQRVSFWVALIMRDAARVEALHGDLDRALWLYQRAVEAFSQSGNVTNLSIALVGLTTVFVLLDRPQVAATIHGTTTRMNTRVIGRRTSLDQLRRLLGTTEFPRCVAQGAAMTASEAARYAREQLQLVRRDRAMVADVGEEAELGRAAPPVSPNAEPGSVGLDGPGPPAPA
jgi:hypothetical protein